MKFKLTWQAPGPDERAYIRRFDLMMFVTGIVLAISGMLVWMLSHWLFDAVLAPQRENPQALRVMAIWNVLMVFVPWTMVVTGMVMALAGPLLGWLLTIPFPGIRRVPAAEDVKP